MQWLTSGAALRKSTRDVYLFNDVLVLFNASKKEKGVTKLLLRDLIVITKELAYSPETGQIDCWQVSQLTCCHAQPPARPG